MSNCPDLVNNDQQIPIVINMQKNIDGWSLSQIERLILKYIEQNPTDNKFKNIKIEKAHGLGTPLNFLGYDYYIFHIKILNQDKTITEKFLKEHNSKEYNNIFSYSYNPNLNINN